MTEVPAPKEGYAAYVAVAILLALNFAWVAYIFLSQVRIS
jgi:hypothetical protein